MRWINRTYDITELRAFLLQEKEWPYLERAGLSYQRVEGGNGLCAARYDLLGELSAALGEFKAAADYCEKARWVGGGSRLRYPDDSFMGKHLQSLVDKYVRLSKAKVD